jgi:hypothetical protein
MDWIYVFNGSTDPPRPSLAFPGGVFSSREKAETWIAKHRLSGILTAYPLDQGAYDWNIENGFFTPKRNDQKTPEFIGRYSSAYTGHWHYEHGSPGSSD